MPPDLKCFALYLETLHLPLKTQIKCHQSLWNLQAELTGWPAPCAAPTWAPTAVRLQSGCNPKPTILMPSVIYASLHPLTIALERPI